MDLFNLPQGVTAQKIFRIESRNLKLLNDRPHIYML